LYDSDTLGGDVRIYLSFPKTQINRTLVFLRYNVIILAET